MAILATYNSRKVKIVFLNHVVQALAADDFLEISLNADLTVNDIGGDGSVGTSMTPDETGTCTLRLMQGSPTNVFLSGVLAAQRETGKLAEGSFTVKDPSGIVVAKLSDAHITVAPTTTLGSTTSGKTIEWQFFCKKVDFASVPANLSGVVGLAADAIATVESLADFLR